MPIDRNFQKRDLMINQKTQCIILSTLLISTFSCIQSSTTQKNPAFFNGMTLKSNSKDPKNPTQPDTAQQTKIDEEIQRRKDNASTHDTASTVEPAQLATSSSHHPTQPTNKQKEDGQKIADYLAERSRQANDFDHIPEITAKPSARLGDVFIPTVLPEQTSTVRPSKQGWTEGTSGYILRLIENGQFPLALLADTTIFESLGQALKDSALAFAAKQKEQQSQNHSTLEQQRPDFQSTTNAVHLIALAGSQCCKTGSIVPVRIEEILALLETEQRKMEQETDVALFELTHREQRLKKLRQNVLQLHATASTLRPISPQRKVTIGQPK